VLEGDDGVIVPYDAYVDATGAACNVTTAADGLFRCLPAGQLWRSPFDFSDPSCTINLTNDIGCARGVVYASEVVDDMSTLGCDNYLNVRRVFKRGTRAVTSAYSKGGTCFGPYGLPAATAETGEEIPLERFAELPTALIGGTRIQQRAVRAEGGLWRMFGTWELGGAARSLLERAPSVDEVLSSLAAHFHRMRSALPSCERLAERMTSLPTMPASSS
jgi:hypothetical protein